MEVEKKRKMKTDFTFFVNGKKICDPNVDPSISLLTYLRQKLHLPGTKMGCNEGACGSCTVMVSKLDRDTQKIKHYSLNACLAPIGTLHGQAVTTVEGIGSTKTRLHPVQERLAKSHGSQCGFCTPGFVMSMYTLLRNNPEPTMEEIEDDLVGNLCRCTGYRPILEGFRTFSREAVPGGCGRSDCCQLGKQNSDTVAKDTSGCKIEQTSVLIDPTSFAPYDPTQEIIFPPELQLNHDIYSQSLTLRSPSQTFIRVVSLHELLKLKDSHPNAEIAVGNTKIGIDMNVKHQKYPLILYPVNIPELTKIEVTDSHIIVGAAASVSDIEREFKTIAKELPESKTKIVVEILEMLKWFAGRQIKNVASLGGSVMSGLSNSDFNTILMASGVALTFKDVGSEREVAFDDKFYVNGKQNVAKPNEVLVSLKIPLTKEGDFFRSYKQARRRGKDMALVNAAIKVSLDLSSLKVKELALCFGGVTSTTVMALKTMEALKGSAWDENFLKQVTSLLIDELKIEPTIPASTEEYKTGLAVGFFFKFYLSVCEELHNLFPNLVSPLKKAEEEAAKPYKYLPTASTQFFQNVPEGQEKIDPIGRPVPHVSCLKQTTGEATFTDDIPRFENELFAVLVLSSRPHAKILQVDSSEALKLEGVEGFFSAEDLPGEQNAFGYIVPGEEEVFASKEVRCVGQIIGAVVASTKDVARRAAMLVNVVYEDLPNPIFTIEEAIEANSVWDPMVIESGNVEEAFKNSKHILEGQCRSGGQEHFYLETNSHIAIPYDDKEVELICTTQSPTQTQGIVAKALGLDCNRVYLKVKRMGGAFGGKESRFLSAIIAIALAALKTKRPVRIVVDRREDMLITAGRHPFLTKWKVGFEDDGKLNALEANYYSNGGRSLDLSNLVIMMTLLNANNAYQIDNVKLRGQSCRTNMPSNTAFRGFGSPQTLFVIENIMAKMAEYLHLDQLCVRKLNMYGKSSYTTHYGQIITNSTVSDCWKQVLSSSNYEERNVAVRDFNNKNAYKKRGISAMPLKFGIGVNFPFYHQAGAFVMVYLDGSILLSHGGVELGQGLHTKMMQIASRVLQVPIDKIYIPDTATYKVPNTIPTVASISSDLNGMAVLDACSTIKKRLEPFEKKMPNGTWIDWVSAAYEDRVSLSATGYYKMPNIVEYKFDGKPAAPYNYFTFGAAVSEVEIDCLTGDHTVLRTDIVMDVGKSLNPAIDIGQIEGAFTQGYGLFVLEQLLYSPEGKLLTDGPETYKIPCIMNIPREFNVTLLRNSANERAVYSSKGIGEPPLLSGLSVFLAIREAVKAARKEEELSVPFDAPATPERIRMACEDWITQKINARRGPFNEH